MRVTAVATGKVQGVGYRHFVEVCARTVRIARLSAEHAGRFRPDNCRRIPCIS